MTITYVPGGGSSGGSTTITGPLGNTNMASSIPVTLASDQIPIAPAIYAAASMTTPNTPAAAAAYVAGQVIYSTAGSALAVNTTVQITRTSGTNSSIVAARILTSGSTTLTNGLFRLHLYNQQPTLQGGDHTTWSTGNAGYIDSFDVTLQKAFTNSAYGRGGPTNCAVINAAPIAGGLNCYWVLEARAAYTPVSALVYKVSLEVL